jgi:hypothetical protein
MDRIGADDERDERHQGDDRKPDRHGDQDEPALGALFLMFAHATPVFRFAPLKSSAFGEQQVRCG